MAETRRVSRQGPKKRDDEKMPPAGPHAKPELTDKDKTPRSGVLDEAEQPSTEAPTG